MIGSRSLALLVVGMLLVGAAGTATMAVTAARPNVQISSVSVSPSDPAPGENVTVKTTISNLRSSNETVDVTDVYVRTSNSAEEHGRIEDVGSIDPGGTLSVPMSVTFDSTGSKFLTVHVVVRDEGGTHDSYEYPVYVTVEKPDEALLSLSTAEATAGGPTPVNVTVANTNDGAISGVQVTLEGDATVEDPERIKGSLGPGEDRTFRYDVTFDGTGMRTLTADIQYRTARGVTRSITKSVEVAVGDPIVEADLSVRTGEDVSGPTDVTLANVGNTALTNIEVTATADGAVVARRPMADVDLGSNASVTFGAWDPGDGPVTFTATYTAVGTTYSTTLEKSIEAVLSTDISDSGSGVVGVEVTNFGNTLLSQVEVTATVDGETVARKLVADVEPRSNRTVMVDTGNTVNGPVTFTATYTAFGHTYTTSVTEDLEDLQVSGEIHLTGIETTRSATAVTIEGEAANIGSTDAESVLLGVQNTADVSPGSPSGEYFVGAVDASEFATFELTAWTRPGATSVPVEITYIVDGGRVTTTQRLDIGSADPSASSGSGPAAGGSGGSGRAGGPGGPPGTGGPFGGLSPPTIGIVLALLVVAAVGFGVYRWRQQ